MPTFALQDAEHLIAAIVADLTNRKPHVANILLGPQREAWFNAELFVTASGATPYPSGEIAFYGEQSFNTIRSLCGQPFQALRGNQRLPDLVGHWVTDSEPVATVVEQKVIYSNDASLGFTAIRDLEDQMRNAATQLRVAVLGIAYLIKAPRTWGGNPLGIEPRRFYAAVEASMDQQMPDPQYQWVRRPSKLAPGQSGAPLEKAQTSTGGWSAFFSLEVAAKYLAPQVANSAVAAPMELPE